MGNSKRLVLGPPKTRATLVLLSSLYLAASVTGNYLFATPPVEKRPQVKQGNVPVAVVSLRETKTAQLKEYRINGVVRAVKYTPKDGSSPYYMIDRDGSGEFIRLGPDMGAQVQVPSWIILTW